MVEIFINNTLIETNGEEAMSLNYTIADIREPGERQQTHSKTITIPGTKVNDKLFQHIFEVNREGGFNPNIKADVLILEDSIEQLRGSVQLKRIVENSLYDRTYEIVCFGELIDLYNEMGKGKLEDLSFSEYNHTWTQTNQRNSWDTSIIQNSGTVAFSLGNGYVYPLIDYGFSSNQTDYDVTELFPALYVKTIVDKIFSTYGFTYDSDFFESTFFKSLIIPFSRQRFQLSEDQILDRLFQAQTTGTTSFNMSGTVYGPSNATDIPYENESTGGNFDTGGNYSTPTFTVPDTGYYDFVSQAFVGYRLTPATSGVTVSPTIGTFKVYVQLLVNSSVVNSKVININLVNTPNFATQYTSSGTVAQPDPLGVFLNTQYSTYSNLMASHFTGIELQAGDTVKAQFFPVINFQQQLTQAGLSSTDRFEIVSSPGTYMNGDYEVLIFSGGKFYNKVSNVTITEGGTVDMSSVLPVKILQSDFLTSIIKMFNLYTEKDPNNPKNYIISPRDDFYGAGVNVNWEDKFDVGSDYTITPVGTIDSGKYKFSYTEDKDFFNTDYQEKYGEVYGEEDIDVQNDFINNVTEIKVIFSPTPIADNGFSDMVMPRIIQKDNNGGIAPYAGNIRILYYGGLRTITNTQWTHTSDLSGDISSFEYPYSGHLDDPFNPTLDINFGVVREVYYDDLFTPIVWTNNNLYNKYYSKQIAEITDPESILLEGMFNLSPYDVSSIDFRNQYWFFNAYWRLNKIIDYNPSNNSLTKCEFLKIKQAEVFTAVNIDDIGQATGTEYNPPSLPSNTQYNGNVYDAGPATTVQGSGNYVAKDSTNIDIVGDNNFVHSDTRNISITGDGNTVLGGVENVSLINTSGVTVSESDVSYVNGSLVSGTGATILVTDDTTVDESPQMVVVDATDADTYITLPSSPSDGKTYDIKKIDSTGNLVYIVVTGEGNTIDGETSQTLSVQYENLTVKYSEANGEYSII